MFQSEKAQKKNEQPSFKDTLLNYCDTTGVYTLKQIAEPTRYRIRRYYWIAVLISAVVMFSIQTYDSTIRYFSYESSVSMKINFIDRIRFPAVTICNQNAFKATKLAELDLYKEVSSFYTNGKLFANATNKTAAELQLANMTFHKLYTTTAHNLSDFLVQCNWNGIECSLNDFATTLTDYGVCYTFNNLQPGVPAKETDRSGSQHALQVQLNIEQYEYMKGPHEGAGVRVFLHDQEKSLPITSLGQSIPPGAHAQLSAKIIVIKNLKPSYGKCEDDLTLKYHSDYTKHSCSVDCLQHHLIEKCGCKEFYMPQNISFTDESPHCTVQHKSACVQPLREQLQDEWSEECHCPISCKYTTIESYITYGSTSNFDMDKLLNGNLSDLHAKYVHAREISQKVNDYTVATNEKLVSDFESVVSRIDSVYEQLQNSLEETVHHLHEILEDTERRAKFHSTISLDRVRYMVEYNFKRYWAVYSERVFDFLTDGYYTLGGSVKRIVGQIGNGSLPNRSQREMKWFPVDNELLNKADLINRAVDYLQLVNHSYSTAEPLGTYKATRDRHYDQSLIAPELFASVQTNLAKYMSNLFITLDRLLIYIEDIRTIGNMCVSNLTCDETTLYRKVSSFEYRCGRFNYYTFLINDRIISRPMELMDTRISDFDDLSSNLHNYHDILEDIRAWISELLSKAKSGFWYDVHSLKTYTRAYMQNSSMLKTDLSIYATSKTMTESILNSRSLLQQLRGRGQEFKDGLQKVQKSAFALYVGMAQETTTRIFYQKLNEEILESVSNTSDAAHYKPYFESLLGYTINVSNYTELIPLLNADFIDINLTQIETQHMTDFAVLYKLSDVDTIMGNIVNEFDSAHTKLRTSLFTFLEDNTIGMKFVRENFLKLDVFLGELSYTEITQQVAYDFNNLLGDIGGSAGLFVGASLITLCEILDLLFHGACSLKAKLKKTPPVVTDTGLHESQTMNDCNNRFLEGYNLRNPTKPRCSVYLNWVPDRSHMLSVGVSEKADNPSKQRRV